MWVWATASWGGELTLADARGLGVPAEHAALDACDCIALTWTNGGADSTYQLPRSLVQELRHEVTPAGRHDLTALLTDGTTLSLEQAPCAITTSMAATYAIRLDLTVTGSGVGVACNDAIGALDAYLTPHLAPLTPPNYGPLASVRVTDPDGNPDDELSDAWSSERPYLGRCFRADGAPRPGVVELTGRLDRDGTSRLRVEVPGPDDAVALCVASQLGSQTLPEGLRKRKVRVRVGWNEVEDASAPAVVSP
jgi:hypothetical protein